MSALKGHEIGTGTKLGRGGGEGHFVCPSMEEIRNWWERTRTGNNLFGRSK